MSRLRSRCPRIPRRRLGSAQTHHAPLGKKVPYRSDSCKRPLEWLQASFFFPRPVRLPHIFRPRAARVVKSASHRKDERIPRWQKKPKRKREKTSASSTTDCPLSDFMKPTTDMPRPLRTPIKDVGLELTQFDSTGFPSNRPYPTTTPTKPPTDLP